MQMMSDSLAACKQMSKGRPLRKMYGVKGNALGEASAPRTSVQVLLSPEENTLDNRDDEEEGGVIVSYMVRETRQPRKSGSDGADGCQRQSHSRRRGSWSSAMEESLELLEGSSKIQMYDYEEVEASRMVEVIRRELKALREMAPPVTLLATALSDAICHYKECDRCSEKISPSLPWILNRIQKLIKYVTIQRQRSYRWPDDHSYLRLRPADPTAPPHSPPRASGRLLAKSDKVDAVSAAEDIPGLQLLLELTPDTTLKKLFETAENRPVVPPDSFLNFSVVQLREPKSASLVQVLLPDHDPVILLDEKREALALREFAHAPRLVFAFCQSPEASLLLPTPVASLTRTLRPGRAPGPGPPGRAPGQERPDHPKKNPEGPPRGRSQRGENAHRQTEGLPERSHDKDPLSSRDLLARVPEIVREFLLEAREEKMHDESMRNLAAGAKGLRDLMAEVHRNQMELSKVLLEKGVYPQPIIKLTDPDMLEKETEVMRRVAELQGPGSRGVSVKALQTAVDDVKHRCALKNRVILIILKGLRSDIPKDWWEDMVEYVLEEWRPGEELREASGSPGNGVQASRLQARPLRTEERPSEEEPKVKGSEGADVEERPEKRRKCDEVAAKAKEVTSMGDPEGFSERMAASPAAEDPSGIGISITKLENQVSLLNKENERLRHEVEDLKDLLRSSVEDLRERRVSGVEWEQRPSGRAAGKTINLTIEIVDATKPRNVSVAGGSGGRGRSPAVKYRDADSSSGPAESEAEEGESRSRSELGRSESERSCLEETSSRVSSRRPGGSESGSVPREKARGQSSRRASCRTAAARGRPSGHEVFRKVKPAAWAGSECGIAEVSYGRRADAWRRPVDVGRLLQKPSLMELVESRSPGTVASMANERELHTIPENECGPSPGSSKGMSQAIERLRSRVRSIHKDVAVLKSKNDRIDKLLDRLMDDAVENGESFEEMENDLNRFKDQLG